MIKYTEQLEKLYLLDIAQMALWSDEKLEINEDNFLKQLSQDLDLGATLLEKSAKEINLQIIDPNPASQNIRFVIQTGEKTPVWDYVVIQVIEFPWINLVWAGTIIMVIGFVLAIINRIKKQKQLTA